MKSGSAENVDWSELAKAALYNASEMASLLKMSLRQFERVFVEDCGMTPQEWLNHVRNWRAVLMVVEGRAPKQFFSDLGFEYASGFFHAFKAYHGCTTRQYARNHVWHKERSKSLRDYFGAEESLPELDGLPVHVHALKFLTRVPLRSERLAVYALRVPCRRQAPPVDPKHPVSPKSTPSTLPSPQRKQ